MRQVNLLDMVAGAELNEINDPYRLLDAIKESDCTRCRRAEFRKANEGQQITVYRGDPSADLWVVGKSPGVQDGLEGTPFSYGSGDLLFKWIRFLGLDPATGVFMTNPVFCAAEGDLSPIVAETRACALFFDMLVARLKPKRFLALGTVAVDALVGKRGHSMKELAGLDHALQSRFDIPIWVVYHPAFFFKGSQELDSAKAKTRTTLKALRGELTS